MSDTPKSDTSGDDGYGCCVAIILIIVIIVISILNPNYFRDAWSRMVQAGLPTATPTQVVTTPIPGVY